ncbi:Crp/Fnr family transcriptional regulator [Methylobacterium brachythecii]|uniref:CRP-like cAMP-binding protein n=1 Tax=Methylobacterium brachythecii TaxID=1176177 RepID=A0A7W6ANK1_9HYPH|nr:Crp/Fnr family transcriptional regulator [Methylobacterium brachythecii]MBB3903856.1 CRP-like cAMP-binding protein [Methylobacterium brachythecii]GLS44771.1 cyclic nucleotide-binding protein [Methylobacterium brachythecii]
MAADLALLVPSLVPVPLDRGQVLIEPGQPIRELVFPESGFVSVVTGRSGGEVEIALLGCEGLVGAVPSLLGIDRTPDTSVVQAAGRGYRIRLEALETAVDRSPTLRRLLLTFVHTLYIQTAQTARTNLTDNLEARLARWLLMCQDRLGGSDIAVTHEFLAVVLGVQRSSVTVAIQMIEGRALIKARRGRIHVVDRRGLEAVAGTSYGLPEAEYARLIEAE